MSTEQKLNHIRDIAMSCDAGDQEAQLGILQVWDEMTTDKEKFEQLTKVLVGEVRDDLVDLWAQ